MKYEILITEADPFDIMCDDCPVHEIQYWEEISLEKLHKYHEECLEGDIFLADLDKKQYEDMTGERWIPVSADFDEFVKSEIQHGKLRVA